MMRLPYLALQRLLFALLIGVSPIAFAQEEKASPPKTETPKSFSVTIAGDIDPASPPVIGRLTTLFYESYPKLYERFSNPDHPAPTQLKLHFKQELRVPAYCSGSEVTINLDWLQNIPTTLVC